MSKDEINIDGLFSEGKFNDIAIGNTVDSLKYISDKTQRWQQEYGSIKNYKGVHFEVRLDKEYKIDGFSIDRGWQNNKLVVSFRGKQRTIFKLTLNSLIDYLNDNNINWQFKSVMKDTIFIVLEDSNLLLSYCFESGFKHGLVKISL